LPLRCKLVTDTRPTQRFDAENTGEAGCIAAVSELQTKPDLAARKEGQLEQFGLDPMVVEPGPHLSHGGAKLGAAAPDLDNVHLILSR
jgi:hypothetical protein